MADSDSEDHYGRNEARPESKREYKPYTSNNKMIEDDDDGFDQDDDSQLFKRLEMQEQEKQSNNEYRESRKLKKLKKIKKRRRGSDEDSFQNRQSNSDSEEYEQEKRFKSKKQRSNKKGEVMKRRPQAKPKEYSQREIRMRMIREQSRRQAETLLDEMNKRYEEDRQSKYNDGPALAKLKYLKDMESALENIFVQEYFLESDGLNIIEKWLRRYSNGEEPSYAVRKKVLYVILMMDVKSNHILKCHELPSLIEKLKKSNKSDQAELRRICYKISFKWQTACNFDYGKD